jgi:hypothetical protein
MSTLGAKLEGRHALRSRPAGGGIIVVFVELSGCAEITG